MLAVVNLEYTALTKFRCQGYAGHHRASCNPALGPLPTMACQEPLAICDQVVWDHVSTTARSLALFVHELWIQHSIQAQNNAYRNMDAQNTYKHTYIILTIHASTKIQNFNACMYVHAKPLIVDNLPLALCPC